VLQRDADAELGGASKARSETPWTRQPGALVALGNRLFRRLSDADRAALGIWVAAHGALLVLAWAAAWALQATTAHAPLTSAFEHWDAAWFRNIAEYGYFGHGLSPASEGFLPGYPLALAGTHLVLRNWVLSELVVSGLAGCFAVVSLARLANQRRAVLYLLAAPTAIFLLVGYAEALYLALAIPAWLAARRGQWPRAALLAGLAGLVRPDALFLIPALTALALIGSPDRPEQSSGGLAKSRQPRLAHAVVACSALVGPAAYVIFLRVTTGSWLAWPRAQQAGWDLHLSSPARALRLTWWAAFEHPFPAGTAFEFQLELAAMAAMLLATVVFGCCRQWPEAVYCGLAVLALGTSTWYQACPRTVLLLFPIWAALARLDARWRWVRYAYFGLSAPLAVVLGMLYLSGRWAG
jgi:hypothetical protein